MLVALNFLAAQLHVVFKRRQTPLVRRLLILTLLVKDGKAVKGDGISGSLEEIFGSRRTGSDNIGLRCTLQTICHLAGDKALPDQLIELILIVRQTVLHLIRRQLNGCRTNRFVAILRVRTRLEMTRGFGQIFLAPTALNVCRNLRDRILRNTQ